jgi:hypothetical protein
MKFVALFEDNSATGAEVRRTHSILPSWSGTR